MAALELLVHLDVEEEPPDLVAIWAEVKDGGVGRSLKPSDLPSDWRRVTGHKALISAGDDWQRSRSSPAMAVPSVVIPEERNILLNPEHPEFSKFIRIGEIQPFSFDRRLFVAED